MSTRCQIIVEESNVVIYRHSDGYPDGPCGVLQPLKALVADFLKFRGWDEMYLPAHILADMIASHKAWAAKAIRKGKKEDPSKPDSYWDTYRQAAYLGYGIEAYLDSATYLHGDIEYLYVVKKNGNIEVRSCFVDEESHPTLDNTKLLKTVKAVKKRLRETNHA